MNSRKKSGHTGSDTDRKNSFRESINTPADAFVLEWLLTSVNSFPENVDPLASLIRWEWKSEEKWEPYSLIPQRDQVS